MSDSFHIYAEELEYRDLADLTRRRYSESLKLYREWLRVESPTEEGAKRFLKHLRDRGYQPRSVVLYYTSFVSSTSSLGSP